MFKGLFDLKEINENEKMFFVKLSQYLIKNCKDVYRIEYIPRLVKRICNVININVELHKGFLYINKNEKRYTIPYVYNFYKGHIVDLGLFIVKDFYKIRQFDSDNSSRFIEVPMFDHLPPYIMSNFKESSNHVGIDNIAYESTKLLLNDNFQPSKISLDDKLLLAVYNDCYAYNIAREISESNLDKNDISPSINFISWVHSPENILK